MGLHTSPETINPMQETRRASSVLWVSQSSNFTTLVQYREGLFKVLFSKLFSKHTSPLWSTIEDTDSAIGALGLRI